MSADAPATLAYVDPGTGSLLLQILLGAFFGAVLTVKMYWRRLKGFLARAFGKSDTGSGPE